MACRLLARTSEMAFNRPSFPRAPPCIYFFLSFSHLGVPWSSPPVHIEDAAVGGGLAPFCG